jgi:hypothetical protein
LDLVNNNNIIQYSFFTSIGNSCAICSEIMSNEVKRQELQTRKSNGFF